MPTRKFSMKVFLFVFIAAFFSSAFSCQAMSSSLLSVGGGILEYGKEEIYVAPFSITQDVRKEEETAGITCESPTFSEYLLAAKLPNFRVSNTFESIESPPYDVCTWNKKVLEAEGVDGHLYFSGIGSHVPKELEYVSGGVNPRDSISRIHYNIYAFWGNEYKPSPRTSRCVQRNGRNLMKGTIKRNTVEVKSRRDQSSKTKMTLVRGALCVNITETPSLRQIRVEGGKEKT